MTHPVELQIGEGGIQIPSLLQAVSPARGLVVHAHASGGARRQEYPLSILNELARMGFSGILADLLTEGESQVRSWTLDVALMSDRLKRVIDWAQVRARLEPAFALPMILIGYGRAGPAVLRVATEMSERAAALVVWDSRPDLSWEALSSITSPVLLLSPALDSETLRSNRWAARLLDDRRLEIVAGASSLLGSEPWAFEAASREARHWVGRKIRWSAAPRSATHPAA